MHKSLRQLVRVLAVSLPVTLSVGLAGSAAADTPVTWDPGLNYSALQVLLIFVGIPLGLVVVISLLASINPGRYADAYPIRPKQQVKGEWFSGPESMQSAEHSELTEGSDHAQSGQEQSEPGQSEPEQSEPGQSEQSEPEQRAQPERPVKQSGGGASANW